MRRLILTNTLNTRDLGGYPINLKSSTCFNHFIRSDVPIEITEEEVSLFKNLNITTIIDLRGDIEIGRTPSFFYGKQGFQYYHCPLNGNGEVPRKEKDIPVTYLSMLEDVSSVYKIMKIFADTDTGFLYHCAAGKDRTGVISALLLAMVYVPMADILADYQISYTYVTPMIERLRLNDPNLPYWVGQSKPEYLMEFFSAFLQKFETVDNYLAYIGLSPLDCMHIRSKLVCS